ncbi:CG43330 [Drosophila busckii]|uniref:CG43330 n=1 Tax=Drosophila busckii TaxID=30019 RepID=A0A0M4EPZ7_DROBS|nr:CG43330 [Drosophila busckii]
MLYLTSVSCSISNCSFMNDHVLQFVCHGFYDRTLRLKHKDRLPAEGTPYAIWQRSDFVGSSMLLIVFYESPLSKCSQLVFDDGDFYCNGNNYKMLIDESIDKYCLPFQLSYADELHKRCKRSKDSKPAKTISSVFIYMDSNIYTSATDGRTINYTLFAISFVLQLNILIRIKLIWCQVQ